MKRLMMVIALPVMVLAHSDVDSCDTDATSRSYLSIVPHFHTASPELVSAFRSDRSHARQEGWHGAWQAVVFGSRSTHADNTARYFFPFGKTELRVAEDLKQIDELDPLNPVDLYPGHFGVETVTEQFESRISIAPRQTVIGGGLHWRQSFWRNEEKSRGLWMSISMPIIHVKNELNFKEKILNDGGGKFVQTGSDSYEAQAATMEEAFKQSGWKYGKIDDSADDMKRTGVADLEIKFGYEWLDTDPCHIESYMGIHVPTGKATHGQYLFEAAVGSKHVGVMFGNSFGCQLWADEENERYLRMEFGLGSKYLFKKEQIRSFDLKHKEFSRYIQLYASQEDANAAAANVNKPVASREAFTPGINILTQEVDVTPGFLHSLNAAWTVAAKSFRAELGYNLLSRQAECIEMNNFTAKPAIKHLFGAGQTNPVRDMTGNFLLETSEGAITGNFPVPVSKYEKSILTVADINLASGSTPANLSHTVYGSIGGDFDDMKWPLLAHLGASYTFSRATNAVMDRWTVWAKLGISL